MWVNVSSVSDDLCFTSQVRFLVDVSFCVMKTIVLLPLCILVLHLYFQRRRHQLPLKPVSHSDVFTFHVVTMELFWVLGFICYLCGSLRMSVVAVVVGLYVYTIVLYGEMLFHTLTCVDWYLAVVRPIIYVQLRSARGVRIRNICITTVWLLCFGLTYFHIESTGRYAFISTISSLSVSIAVVTFCSLSVLCALIRPGPGEGGGEKERVDRLKRRAFCTITAISSVLWLRFVVLCFGTVVVRSPLEDLDAQCLALVILSWFNMPSSLLSPLLFLHRAGKLSLICPQRVKCSLFKM